MTGILAIDTATEACSVAIWVDGQCREEYEVIPRQHSQRLFGMLQSLLPGGSLREQGIDAIAYSSGPGSFTGLRIGASAVQGLAFASDLPAIAISTLACQAQTALRTGAVQSDDIVLSTVDAKINELYYAVCKFERGLAVLQTEARVSVPSALDVFPAYEALHGIGSGCELVDRMPAAVRAQLASLSPDVLPAARDLVPLALHALECGDIQQAQQVQPVYVRDEISWKKLSEQGKAP
jgi:tRNA threonylcarbamoyladenosine biosynthesis protein TsaB